MGKTPNRISRNGFLGSIALMACVWTDIAVASRIAGLEPHRRPADAPSVTTATADANALHGIVKPVPENVGKFMKDQGNWHTPFTRPGMPGPYDIRGWHSKPPSSGKE